MSQIIKGREPVTVQLGVKEFVSYYCRASRKVPQPSALVLVDEDKMNTVSPEEACVFQPYSRRILNLQGKVIYDPEKTIWNRIKGLICRLMGR